VPRNTQCSSTASAARLRVQGFRFTDAEFENVVRQALRGLSQTAA
jgi:hypothetical protein